MYSNIPLTTPHQNFLFSNSYISLMNKPTQITQKTATLIDNVFADKYDNHHKFLTGILIIDIWDHYSIFHMSFCQNKTKEDYQLIQLINGSYLNNHINDIQNHDLSLVNHHYSCQAAFTYFSKTLKGIFHNTFPVIRVNFFYRNRLPWLADGLQKAIKHKKNVYYLQ